MPWPALCPFPGTHIPCAELSITAHCHDYSRVRHPSVALCACRRSREDKMNTIRTTPACVATMALLLGALAVATRASSVAHVQNNAPSGSQEKAADAAAAAGAGAGAAVPGEYRPVGCGEKILWAATRQWSGNYTRPTNCKRLLLNSSSGICNGGANAPLMLPSFTIEAFTGPSHTDPNESAPFYASGNTQTPFSVLNHEGIIVGSGECGSDTTSSRTRPQTCACNGSLSRLHARVCVCE
jgi:hypothetical protein